MNTQEFAMKLFGGILLALTILSFGCSEARCQNAMRNGLPQTSLDSFVTEAGEHKEHIYGDEGVYGPPPYLSFSKVHRINTGIMDQRDAGLTTGHGWYAPDSWGKDEFLGQEWTLAGARGRKSSDGFVDGLPNILVTTGSSSGGGNMGQVTEPPPGEGFQPMFQHGVWVGWYTPDQVRRSQTEFPCVLQEVINGPYFWGDAWSISMEIAPYVANCGGGQ